MSYLLQIKINSVLIEATGADLRIIVIILSSKAYVLLFAPPFKSFHWASSNSLILDQQAGRRMPVAGADLRWRSARSLDEKTLRCKIRLRRNCKSSENETSGEGDEWEQGKIRRLGRRTFRNAARNCEEPDRSWYPKVEIPELKEVNGIVC